MCCTVKETDGTFSSNQKAILNEYFLMAYSYYRFQLSM